MRPRAPLGSISSIFVWISHCFYLMLGRPKYSLVAHETRTATFIWQDVLGTVRAKDGSPRDPGVRFGCDTIG